MKNLNGYVKAAFAALLLVFSVLEVSTTLWLFQSKAIPLSVLLLISVVFTVLGRLSLRSMITHLGEAGAIRADSRILLAFKTKQSWLDPKVFLIMGGVVAAVALMGLFIQSF